MTTESASSPPNSADAFSGKELKGHVADLLDKSTTSRVSGEVRGVEAVLRPRRSSPESPEDGLHADGAAVEVPECIQRGIGDRTPLAAEEGTYEGKRAYLVVVPHDSDSDMVSAYVVDAAVRGHVLAVRGQGPADTRLPAGLTSLGFSRAVLRVLNAAASGLVAHGTSSAPAPVRADMSGMHAP